MGVFVHLQARHISNPFILANEAAAWWDSGTALQHGQEQHCNMASRTQYVKNVASRVFPQPFVLKHLYVLMTSLKHLFLLIFYLSFEKFQIFI